MNSREKVFVILTPAFPAYEGESWLPAQEEFVKALNKDYPALNVTILTFHYPLQSTRSYQWNKNRVVTFSGGMKSSVSKSIIRWGHVWMELRSISKKQTIIGLFSFFCSECAFVGHYFSRFFTVKHYIWVLGQDARKGNKQVRRIRPRPEELICISDFLVREFKRNHNITPAYVVPIGINPSLYKVDSLERSITVLGAGSLIPLKQYDVFVKIVKSLSDAGVIGRAIICGDGPEKERLKLLIKEFGLEHQLSITGMVAHTTVLEKMQQAKILLHTSSYEGFGAVCLEALYAGAHVISFCRPMDSVIPHWHFVETDEEMISKALVLLEDKNLDHTPILPFEISQIAKDIMNLYSYKS